MYLDEQQQTFGYAPAGPPTGPVGPGEPFRAGRYVILAHVGHGAMGNVYAAYDPDLDRKVAVKVLRDSTRGRPLPASLDREAKAMAKLAHAHVVTVFDVGSCDRGVFVAMEFVEGVTLRTWLKEQVRDWREILGAFVQAGEGLAAAHAAGVIHHDFKPDNVLVGAQGIVKVADFGLARVAASTMSTISGELSDAAGVTRSAAVGSGSGSASGSAVATQASERGPVGTLAYMAPERHLLRPADARSDQFSFCVALYEALYHQRPFTGTDVAALRQAVLYDAPAEPPKGTPVPARVAAVLKRGLLRAPEERFPTMHALLAALAEPAPRRRHWTLSAGLVLGAAGAMMAATRSEDRCAAIGLEADVQWQMLARETGSRFAGAAVAEQLARVGEVQGRWLARARDNCEAGQSGRLAPDLRRAREACLDQRAAQVRAGLAGAAAAHDAEEALYLLREIAGRDDCDDAAALSGVTPPALADAAAVQAERRALAVIAGLEVAGAYTEAITALGPLQRRVEGLGHAPLLAELLYQRARLEHYRGDPERARETLLRAVDLAESQRHDRVAADAWGFLVEVGALPPAAEPATLAGWHRRARAAQARLRGDEFRGHDLGRFLDEHDWTPWRTPRDNDPQQVHPALMRGLVLLNAGDATAAARSFADGLAEPGLHPLTRAKLTLNRAVALQEQVGDAEAMRAWDEAVAAYRSATWAGHPALSRALLKRGEFSLWKQDSEAAARDFRAALPGLESDAASHTGSLRSAHTGLALAAVVRLRVDEAAREVEAALALGGEDDPLLASVGCEARLVAGAPREARLFATREVELLREADDAMAAARAEVHLGEVLMYLGDAPAARAQLEAALQHFAELGGAATQDTAYARKALGLLALRGRDEATAEAALTGALALWDAEPCGCRDAAEAQLGLAVLLGRRGDAGAPALRSAADAYFKPLGAEAIAHRDRVVAFVDADPLLEDPEDMP